MIKKIRFNHRNYLFKLDDSDPSVEGCIKEIIYNNEYKLEKFIDIHNSILDIGANCGICSIILARQNPKAIIYSFEPFPKSYNLLLENIKLNNISNIISFNFAVSGVSNEILKLYLHPSCSGANITGKNIELKEYFNKEIEAIDVKTISFDDIITNNNITNIELLKIDCEGAEYDILYNSIKFKQNYVKNLIGEFHNLEYNNTSNYEPYNLFDYCKKNINGYISITLLEISNYKHTVKYLNNI